MTYLDELRMQGTRALARHPELLHVWRDDGSLTFPPTADEGFEVSLHPNACAITVFTGVGWHHALDGEPTEAVEQALGLTRDLLSSDCRIREGCAAGQPYRWTLERRESETWLPESTTALLFWNYFGRRSERFYQNNQLPGRLTAGSSESNPGSAAG
jgi:hypothetical protein